MTNSRIGGRHELQQRIGTASRLAGARKALSSDDKRCSPLTRALSQLDREGMSSDNVSYASLVRWCGIEKALSHGRRVHAHISASGRDRNTFLANLLVQMYGRCGSVEDARNVFNRIRQRDMFSWNFMIAVYAQNGHEGEALQLYTYMQTEGVKPNKFTFFSALSISANLRALAVGKQIHKRIAACGLESDLAVRNAIVNMYGKCGSLKDARAVFDKIHERDVITWTAMISAYGQNGRGEEALELVRKMDLAGVKPNRVTLLSTLDACASMASIENGRVIHERIVASGFESDIAVRNALINMYGKCGVVEDAWAVFDEMHERNVITWTAMIAAYAQNGHGKEALELFRKMNLEGVKPDRITFLSALDACANLASLENGRAIHECIVASGLEWDVAVRTALINMYGKCGSLKDARAVFDVMLERNVITWTAMIAAYAHNGHGTEALELFRQMNLQGIMPDKVTFINTLEACASLASLENGRVIHKCIIASGCQTDVVVRTALVNMYGKCGALKDAWALFDDMRERDLISWNAMIAAYAQNEHGKEALELFRQMDLEKIKPDKITFLSTLDACASLASLEKGRAIHKHIVASGFEWDVAVRNALVKMYGKCGVLTDARATFDEMQERDVLTWNAMTAAYAQNGDVKETLELFRQMDWEGVQPNKNTFLNLFSACSHAGLLDMGWKYFVSMSGDYGIIPSKEHYVCMSDLLGRAGCLDEAEDLIINMPSEPNTVAWTTLLGACRIHGDVERGARAAEHAVELDPENPSPYILLSNIYAAAESCDSAENVRKAVEDRGLKKKSDCYWVNIQGTDA